MQLSISMAYLGGHWAIPPLACKKNLVLTIRKNRKTWFGPLCVSTSGLHKFAPPYEILNTPLVYNHYIRDVTQLELGRTRWNLTTSSQSSAEVVFHLCYHFNKLISVLRKRKHSTPGRNDIMNVNAGHSICRPLKH